MIAAFIFHVCVRKLHSYSFFWVKFHFRVKIKTRKKKELVAIVDNKTPHIHTTNLFNSHNRPTIDGLYACLAYSFFSISFFFLFLLVIDKIRKRKIHRDEKEKRNRKKQRQPHQQPKEPKRNETTRRKMMWMYGVSIITEILYEILTSWIDWPCAQILSHIMSLFFHAPLFWSFLFDGLAANLY